MYPGFFGGSLGVGTPSKRQRSPKCSCDPWRSRRSFSRHLAANAAAEVSDVVGAVCSEDMGCYLPWYFGGHRGGALAFHQWRRREEAERRALMAESRARAPEDRTNDR